MCDILTRSLSATKRRDFLLRFPLCPCAGCEPESAMKELNENEREVLRILWQADQLKPAEIQADFAWRIENATLRSVLRNLLEKQYVTRQKQGKAFVYRAKSRRGAQFSRAMQRMAEIFTGGSKVDLILELLRRENLSDSELQALHQIAQEKKSDSE